MKSRAVTAAHCQDCGKQLRQKTSQRCRPCHLTWMSSQQCQERFAQARATGKGGTRTSKDETQLAELLDALGIGYESQVPYGRWVIDFWLPLHNCYIEVHGSYWHDQHENKCRDLNKRQTLQRAGHRVLYLHSEEKVYWLTALCSQLSLDPAVACGTLRLTPGTSSPMEH